MRASTRFSRFLLAFGILFFMSTMVFAHGKKDVDEKEVSNLQSWQESFDINAKKKGKYNIYVTASDLGGNKTTVGPYNIYVDPNSDLPVSGITNPHQGMRIVGNLNIVGTCVDDDAVDYVELILDGDEENPIRAEGKEFWSYYLVTNDLEEGSHKIKVTGVDINGLRGNSTELTWNLDRRQPITSVTNTPMGSLVSGKVNLKGTVEDGNGIKSLHYSLDNGKTFSEAKLSKKGNQKDFSISVDTKKYNDGASVIWFKAVDNSGSIGYYSFLYFIDNTKPDVAIIQPQEKETQFGKIGISGYAKDTMGIAELSWQFGSESGQFELIPGNPYWGIEFDLATAKEKSKKFTITAKDIAGNVVNVSRNIVIDQGLDKPVVQIADPVADSIIETNDFVFVRGIATDIDGIASVKYRLDDGEWIEEQTKGVFCGKLAEGTSLAPGKHSITVVATDRRGIVGNPFVRDFYAKGAVPEFVNPVILGGRSAGSFVNGISVHPEDGASFQVAINSSVGLSNVHTAITGGKNLAVENDLTIKEGSNSALVNIPLNTSLAVGIVKIVISATDTAGRTVYYKALVDVENVSKVSAIEPAVVFDDSTVSENGLIINNQEFPASGYFIGGNAKSVELVPATPFAKAVLKGNSISLVPSKTQGISESVVVRVTTDQGLTYDSKKIVFKYDESVPVVKINGNPVVDGSNGKVDVSGSVQFDVGLSSFYYRIFSSKAVVVSDVLSGMESVVASEKVDLGNNRSFTIPFDAMQYGYGIYIIEVSAESIGGKKSSSAVMIKNLPNLPETDEKGKPISAKAPFVVWADGDDVHYAAAYQGELETAFGSFPREQMKAELNPLSISVSYGEGKSVSSKYNATKVPSLEAYIASVNGEQYVSGMPVQVPANSSASMQVYIDTDVPVGTVSFEITGNSVPGGAEKQSGSVKATKLEGSETRWIAEVPLTNLPVRVNNVKVSIKAGSVSKEIRTSVEIVRPLDESIIDDERKIYTMESSDAFFDSDTSSYVMNASSKFYMYANVASLKKAEIIAGGDGLSLENVGNCVVLSPTKDGLFNGVVVRVTDSNGITYKSPAVNFIVDRGSPELNISTPALHAWVKKSLKIAGTAADPSGIKSVEYSIDGGETWKAMTISGPKAGVTFSAVEDISAFEDGLVRVDLRSYDVAGNIAYARTAAYKDVTPPEVSVIVPSEEAVVNGDNYIAFNVFDNGSFERACYVAPPVKAEKKRIDLKDSNGSLLTGKYVSSHIGTAEQPIDDAMSFEFYDDAGNCTTVESWKFFIDSKSDLPIVEIHLPSDNEVITRDFTISGVAYDDDGACDIYYKIDKGEYVKLPEKSTSFAVDVPFSTMVDNEHTISVYAVDLNGVQGPVCKRNFRVSTEEPKGAVVSPSIDKSVKGTITLKGVASDKNGIEKVMVSLDNGNSYNNVVGTEDWSYTVDSRAIPNGTNVVFIRIFDKYGIEGLYSSLINIDNQKPEMILDYPLDDSTTAGSLFFSGYAFDNVDITELYVQIRSLEGKDVPAKMKKIPFNLERIISNTLDISSLANGTYNIELTALDKAGNTTNVSRNITLDKTKPLASVSVLYPLNGEHKQGVFNVYGEAVSEKNIEKLSLYIDNNFVAETQLTSSGYFVFKLGPENISAGVHEYRVDAQVEGGTAVRSMVQTVEYSPVGPWVTIENFTYGDFAVNRPYIQGHAGYSLDEEELLHSKMKQATKEEKAIVAAKKVEKVEVSFDNGKTFAQVSAAEKWMYRVENQDIEPGYHFMLVRATMRNGETAIERVIIQIDNTAPEIRLISPGAGGRYNQELSFSGLSSDDVGLESVKIGLRKGDKASYEVPSFIQGLYLDWHFWGASLFDIGAGLTFFDDAVKLQFQWGQFTDAQRDAVNSFLGKEVSPMRYGGDNILGLKILANVGQVPFSYFFGHDLEWLSATFAVGANFSLFNQTNSGKPQILSALIGQVEFPRVHFANMKMFSTFSLYYEASLWFIPTDVAGSENVDIKNMVFQNSLGIRMNVF